MAGYGHVLKSDGLLLFLAAFAVYWVTWRVPEYSDPVWNTHTAVSIAKRGTADLKPFEDLLSTKFVQFERWLRIDGDKVYAKYSLLVPLCAAPFYCAASLFGMGEDSWAVPYMGKLAASFFAALSVVFVYLTVRRIGTRREAVLIAALYAFCTSTFSVSSQALFQHGPSQCFLAISLYLLFRSREDDRALPWLGLTLSLAVWARPLNLIGACAVAAHVFIRRRSGILRLLPGAAAVVLAAAAANWWLCRRLLPAGYGDEALEWGAPFLEGVLAWLISPGRGLLFYTPLVLFSLAGLHPIWRRKGFEEMRALSVGAALYIVVAANWHSRGGGFSYRMLADLSVFLCLFLLPALRLISGRLLPSIAFYALAAASLLIQVAGAATFFTGPPDVWRLNGGRLHCAFRTKPKLFDILLDGQMTSKASRFEGLRAAADGLNRALGGFLSCLVPFPLPGDVKPYCRSEAIGLSAPPRMQNVLLVSIDSLRADHLGCYGYPRNTSPNLDRLAAAGYRFENAVSQASWTLPSHASLLTSRHPSSHGVDRSRRKLGSRTETLAMWLKAMGFYTGAVVSGPFMKRLYGFDRGFHEYDDELAGVDNPHSVVTSDRIHEKVKDFLDRHGNRPFFLFLHYWDVHYDYNPPAPYDRLFDPDYEGDLDASDFEHNRAIHAGMSPRDLEHLVALYDGEIRFVDDHIGMLVKELQKRKLYKETLVVITSDHGDEFFEHGEKGHAHSLYQELVHVPLIVRSPKKPGGKSVPHPAALVDIAPTVLELLGSWGERTRMEGRSLAPLLKRDPLPWRDGPVWSETKRARKNKTAYRGRTARCVRMGRHKCIHYEAKGPRPEVYEFYDLEEDPDEKSPLPPASLAERGFHPLAEWLSEWAREMEKKRPKDQEALLDPETIRTLKRLGYL